MSRDLEGRPPAAEGPSQELAFFWRDTDFFFLSLLFSPRDIRRAPPVSRRGQSHRMYMREKADRARQNRTRKWLPLICRSGGVMLVFWLASPSRRAAQWQPSLAAGVPLRQPQRPAILAASDSRCDRCAPASANVLAKARERPWMALPSCCHAGGAWHGLCGRSWPHSFVQGRRACTVPQCVVCGVHAAPADADADAADEELLSLRNVSAASARVAAMTAAARANDRNCCHPGGSWRGRCGTAAQVAAGAAEFSWKEGYRICNGGSLEQPPQERSHRGRPFTAMPSLRATGGGRLVADGSRAGRVAARRGLIAYLITLHARDAHVLEKIRRLSDALGGAPVRAVEAVTASEALSVAGTPPEGAAAVYGRQASDPEFGAALGCALSHLLAARRALADGASPALVLEEDVSIELRSGWPAPLNALVDALPRHWLAVQLSIVASRSQWAELWREWRNRSSVAGGVQRRTLLRRDYYWSSALACLTDDPGTPLDMGQALTRCSRGTVLPTASRSLSPHPSGQPRHTCLVRPGLVPSFSASRKAAGRRASTASNGRLTEPGECGLQVSAAGVLASTPWSVSRQTCASSSHRSKRLAANRLNRGVAMSARKTGRSPPEGLASCM